MGFVLGWSVLTTMSTSRQEERRMSDTSLSRRVFLAAVGLVPLRVSAAIPTIDDYNGVEGGAVKKTPGYVAGGEKRGDGGGRKVDGGKVTVAGKSELIAEVESAKKETDELRKFVKALMWDDVRAAIKSKLGFFTTTETASLLGGKPIRDSVFGPNAGQALDSAKDAAITLKRLNDVAFSNRIVFFNSVDRQQVSELAQDMTVDIDEPLELIDSFSEILDSILALVNK